MKLTAEVYYINMFMCSFYAQKCSAAQLLFNHQYYAQLYQYIKLEVALNFYAVHDMLCASKTSINLLTQKLLVKFWWNEHQVGDGDDDDDGGGDGGGVALSRHSRLQQTKAGIIYSAFW